MLKHLNLAEMVALSDSWVNDAKRKAQFLAIPEIAALHPKVLQVHADLLSAKPTSAAVSAALQKIIDAANAVDAVHDPLARAVASGIEVDRHHALAADPPDHERVRQAGEVQVKLFPGGMNIINASLLAEAGNTARVAKLLEDEPAIGTFLEAIPVRGKTTLLDTVHRWIAKGAQLGKLEREREVLEAGELTLPTGRVGLNVLRARWIRLVSLMLSNLEVTEAAAEAVEVIRGPVLKASDRARKRYESGSEGTTVDAPSAPAESAAAP